jgi:hypothetical protein
MSRLEDPSPQGSARGSPKASERVLAAGTAGGKRVEMVEHEDGTLGIRIEGSELPQFQWPPGQVESCVQAYLRLVQS